MAIKQKWVNCPKDRRNEFRKIARDSMDWNIKVLTAYMSDNNIFDNGSDEISPYYEHALCFDYVEKENRRKDFFRYQISWGGPSTEIRFYQNNKIEFVYMDWFVGIGFDVSDLECMQWLKVMCLDDTVSNFEAHQLKAMDY